jgi:uncharacterized protein CbrC (UPF0167 family)
MANIKFTYMDCPDEDLLLLQDGEKTCSICGQSAKCFYLNTWRANRSVECESLSISDRDSREVEDDDRIPPAFGCTSCLAQGKFSFVHATELGCINRTFEASDVITRKMIEDITRTPHHFTCGDELWLAHCGDFMTYLGIWQPINFERAAANGNGRAIFAQVIDDPESGMLHYSLEDYPASPEDREYWAFPVHVFRCRGCGVYRAFDEMD